jgi:hypothetical protein
MITHSPEPMRCCCHLRASVSPFAEIVLPSPLLRQNTGGYTSAYATPMMSAEPPPPSFKAPRPTPPQAAEPPAAERAFGFASATTTTAQKAAQAPLGRSGQGAPGAAAAARPMTPAQPASVSKKEPILVQGGSLRTWSYQSPSVEQVRFEHRLHQPGRKQRLWASDAQEKSDWRGRA